MAVDKEILKTRLAEAKEAYHQLMIGAREVSVNIGNFGSVTYNQANRTNLETYIANLKSQIAVAEGKTSVRRKIMKVSF